MSSDPANVSSLPLRATKSPLRTLLVVVGAFLAGFVLATILFLPFKFRLDWVGVAVAVLVIGGALIGSQARGRQLRQKAGVKLTKEIASMGQITVRPHFKVWHADIDRLRLNGQGLEPSTQILRLWEQIQPKVGTLTATAQSALFGTDATQLQEMQVALAPVSIRFLDNGDFQMSFTASGLLEKLGVFPSAVYSPNLELCSVQWGTESE